jgi:ABC-type multidrug transport system fused ATPase/permease subunit
MGDAVDMLSLNNRCNRQASAEDFCDTLQVPVLFTGSMRDNLDPFGKHTDAEVWAALRRAHLAPVVEHSPQVLHRISS